MPAHFSFVRDCKSSQFVAGLAIHTIIGTYVWVDEGMMALLGASAFYSGVSRSCVSLAVMLLESTNDYQAS